MQEFRLPDPGEGLVEAEIVTWRVAVGDRVEVNDILVEVETSKSLVELPSPYAGTVTALLVSEGDTVDVGNPIIAIDDKVSVTQVEEPQEDLVPPTKATAVDDSVDGGRGLRRCRRARWPRGRPGRLRAAHHRRQAATTQDRRAPRRGRRRPRSRPLVRSPPSSPVSRRADVITPLPGDQAQPVGAPLPSPGAPSGEPEAVSPAILAKPPVRKLAKDLGVDLGSIAGTGPGGVITRDDVVGSSRPEPAKVNHLAP